MKALIQNEEEYKASILEICHLLAKLCDLSLCLLEVLLEAYRVSTSVVYVLFSLEHLLFSKHSKFLLFFNGRQPLYLPDFSHK